MAAQASIAPAMWHDCLESPLSLLPSGTSSECRVQRQRYSSLSSGRCGLGAACSLRTEVASSRRPNTPNKVTSRQKSQKFSIRCEDGIREAQGSADRLAPSGSESSSEALAQDLVRASPGHEPNGNGNGSASIGPSNGTPSRAEATKSIAHSRGGNGSFRPLQEAGFSESRSISESGREVSGNGSWGSAETSDVGSSKKSELTRSESGDLDLSSCDEIPTGIGDPHVTRVEPPSQATRAAHAQDISTENPRPGAREPLTSPTAPTTKEEPPPGSQSQDQTPRISTAAPFGFLRGLLAAAASVMPGGSWWQIGMKEEGPQGERMMRSLHQLWGFAKKDTGMLSLATLFLAAAALSEVAIPHYLAATIFSASNAAKDTFHHNARMLIVMTVACGVFSGLRAACFGVLNLNMVRRMRTTLFETLISQDIEFFDRESVGELTSRLGSDCQSVSQIISVDLNIILRNSLQGLGAFFFLVRLSWRMTLITMALCGLMWYCLMVYGRFQREIAKVLQDTVAAANEVAEEAFSLARVIRTFGTEKKEVSRYMRPIGRLVEIGKRRTAAYSLWASGGLTIYNAAQVAAVVCGGSAVMAKAITAEQLTRFMLYAEWVVHATWWVGDHWASLMEALGSCDRVFRLLDLPRASQLTAAGGRKLEHLEGRIEFRNVSFAYPTRPTARILDNVSLVINPGERVALVGLSGSGKSTMVGLLLRLYEPTKGEVLLDGVPLPELDVQWYRKQLGVVSQEPRLFSTDIEANIAYGSSSSVTAPQIVAAAQLAYAHDFVSGLPDGYNTVVDNARLSGGQKQRIAIARALVRDPPILILDEATSALDAESEYNVQKALDTAMSAGSPAKAQRKRTVLVIAHRLSTVRSADRIIVMSSGHIIESGTHDELMALGREYAKLNARQLDALS